MSRDLLVLAAFATICILLSPFFKETTYIREEVSSQVVTTYERKNTTIKTNFPKKIILLLFPTNWKIHHLMEINELSIFQINHPRV